MRQFLSLCFLFVFGAVFSQQTDTVDFIKIKADLQFSQKSQVSGVVEVHFKILEDVDSIYLDANNMQVAGLELRPSSAARVDVPEFWMTGDRLVLVYGFKKNTVYELRFSYTAIPLKALYFIGDQIWTQGQGKYTSNWLPSIDDMNEKIIFDLSITFADGYQVLANGTLVEKERMANNQTKWHYKMEDPMSSYLVALVIGDYEKRVATSRSGIPLEYYYEPQDSAKVESTYRFSKQMFDFLEEEIGWPYPWKVYRQVPVREFLYSGMENTSLTIFSDELMVDDVAFNDRIYVNVNAHELAHQWFGDLVTEVNADHHWLQEGFATYYALLAEKEVFGDNYFYWRLYEYAQQLLEQESSGQNTSLLDPQSSSLTFYQKGCWALHVLREQVGESVFKVAVRNYLKKHQFRNVETTDFIAEVEKAGGHNLDDYVSVWLEDSELPQDAMVKSLNKSSFIQEYLDVSCEDYPGKCQDYLVSDISDKAKIKILSRDGYKVESEDFNNGWEVRQAIARKLNNIPHGLKSLYESLLSDPSYSTIEAALYNLWANFPYERARYLHQTKDLYGFNDYNIKLLWLALHLNTVEYQPERKEEVLKELQNYSNEKYNIEVRTNAFKYLKLIGGFNQAAIASLKNATHHHNWRFRQFAKALLEELESDPAYKEVLEASVF